MVGYTFIPELSRVNKLLNINLTCTLTKFWYTTIGLRKSSECVQPLSHDPMGETNNCSDCYTTTVLTYLEENQKNLH